MTRIEAMVYDETLGGTKVTELMVNMVTAEQLPLGKTVASYSEVWDGPVADAKESPYYKHFPSFILNGDYNPRLMLRNRIKVLTLDVVDIEDETPVTETASETPIVEAPEPELPYDETPVGS